MKQDLTQKLGRNVDLRTPGELSRYLDAIRLRHMLDAVFEALSFMEGRTVEDLQREPGFF